MAKSGVTLNGRELLECELAKLSPAQHEKALRETMTDIKNDNSLSDSAKRALGFAVAVLSKPHFDQFRSRRR